MPIALVGAGGWGITHLLERRDQSRHDTIENLKNKVQPSDDFKELRKAARWGDYHWSHLHSWASLDGWLSKRSTTAAAHELEQAAKEQGDQLREYLDQAVQARLKSKEKEAITLDDEKAYCKRFGIDVKFSERLKDAAERIGKLEAVEIKERDPRWAQALLAIGLVSSFGIELYRRLPKRSATPR